MSLLRNSTLLLAIPATLAAILLSAPASAQNTSSEKQSVQDQEGPPKLYDESADAAADIAKALAKAKKENKRVLLQFGANWCGWCHKLHKVFEDEREIARTMLYEYEIVMVDVGRFDKNMELVEKYGAKIKGSGVPFLTVLNADGEVVTNQNTGDLEDGDHHDVVKVSNFLTSNVAAPVSAETVLVEGIAKAKANGKTAFVHLGAPWCGWCHRLEDFMAANQELFDKYFIDIKIDTDRMTGGKEVAERLRGGASGGIPWMVFLDGSGKEIINSDGPNGNVGHPVTDEEIAHFVRMLEAVNVSNADRATFAKLLEEAGAQYR